MKEEKKYSRLRHYLKVEYHHVIVMGFGSIIALKAILYTVPSITIVAVVCDILTLGVWVWQSEYTYRHPDKAIAREAAREVAQEEESAKKEVHCAA